MVLGVAWALLFTAIGLGLRVPLLETLLGPGGRPALDYSGIPGPLTPLSEAFITGVLGSDTRASVVPPTAREPRPRRGSVVTPDNRNVVGHSLINDDAGHAYVIRSIPFTGQTNTAGATRSGDPNECAPAGGTVWYQYTAPRSMGLIAYTLGSDYPLVLGVFEKSGDTLRPVLDGCDSSGSGSALRVFAANAGSTYLFQVTSALQGGALRFNLDPRGAVTQASVSSSGEKANRPSGPGNLTPDGRFVAFKSQATNFVSSRQSESCFDATPGSYSWLYVDRPCGQVFVRDLDTGRTRLVSSGPNGDAGTSHQIGPGIISGNGRYVAFYSDSHNLGPEEHEGWDLFVRDLQSGEVTLEVASPRHTDPFHVSAWRGAFSPSLSHDGRYLAFTTIRGLVPDDDNASIDVYVRDRVTGRFERASVSSNEEEALPSPNTDANTTQYESVLREDLTPFISADGRYVVFRSPAPNLVEADKNLTWDTFVRDRILGTTERVSVSSEEVEGNGPSVGRNLYLQPTISADGRYVVFDSFATNLVSDDLRDGEASNDVYVRDRVLGVTRRIGPSMEQLTDGQLPSTYNVGNPHYPTISSNGRFVAYQAITNETADLANCDPPETTARSIVECRVDVFVYDMVNDVTIPITAHADGVDGWGGAPAVSDDGSVVTFLSRVGDAGLQLFVYLAARPL